MQRPETRYAQCGDISIGYQVFGEGPIDLLYAQGWLSNIEYAWESPDYARFLGNLGRFARVIWFDKRGTGMSDRNVGFPTLDQRVQDITAVLDAAGSEQAALFGVSEGGGMASYFAATHPERVSALVLYGSFARRAWAPDYPWGQTREELQRHVAAFMKTWGKPLDLDDGAPSVAGSLAIRNWFGAFLRFSASPHAAELITRLNNEIDIRSILPTIQAPTLVVHREGDRWHPLGEGRYLAEHIPGAVLRLLPGEDHIPWYGDQDALVAEVEEFITGKRRSAKVDRALVTVLITDIVESTAALNAAGDDRWRMILEQLDTGAGRHALAWGGRIVKNTGDGHMLAFSGPTPAIECAQALMRDAMAQGLNLRAGIHTGECERRGDDLSGMAVHLAARIAAGAAPGAIHTSSTVKDLAYGSGVSFTSVGRKPMKGIPGDWEIFALAV
jgi:pimeloyl-ACP methyl ester carboxylesterase